MTDGASDSGPAVLTFTAHRSQEVTDPLRESDLDVEIVEVADDLPLHARSVETVRRTRAAFRRGQPDLVLLDCYEVMGLLVTLLSLWYRTPIVARLVGDTWLRFENAIADAMRARRYHHAAYYRIVLAIDEFVFARASGFIVVSEALGEVVAERTGCPAERIRTVPVPDPDLRAMADGDNPNDDPGDREDSHDDDSRDVDDSAAAPDDGTERRTARDQYGIDAETVLLTVTNLTFRGKLRGVETVLDEITSLLDRNPDIAYVVAGGGEHAAELDRRLNERGLDPDVRARIHVLGFVDDVGPLYDLADVFVYVSFLDGYPRVVLEAQGAALPVVANDAFGMREQVSDGESGFLVDPSQPGAVRRAVETLVSDPVLRARFGEHGRERLRRENAPAAVGQRLERELRSLADTIVRER